MQLINSIKALRQWRQEKHNIALVPTMGNLHQGHLTLIQEAKKRVSHVVVSIFVNPTQFGENEDFDTYPRTLSTDLEKASQAGADILFAPSVQEMYPTEKQSIWVEPGKISTLYCGQSRPKHFRGVSTVVTKLLNITQADMVFFGKKDFQQLAIIRHMIDELNFATTIIGVDTQRADDGLALSSRNQYLTQAERAQAPQLYGELSTIKAKILNGENNFSVLCQRARDKLNQNGWNVEYIEVARQSDLQIASHDDKELVILAAAKLGSTRLIDNIDFSRISRG